MQHIIRNLFRCYDSLLTTVYRAENHSIRWKVGLLEGRLEEFWSDYLPPRQPVCKTKQKTIDTHILRTLNISLRLSNQQKILWKSTYWTSLYTHGRYCTRADAVVRVRRLLYACGGCAVSGGRDGWRGGMSEGCLFLPLKGSESHAKCCFRTRGGPMHLPMNCRNFAQSPFKYLILGRIITKKVIPLG